MSGLSASASAVIPAATSCKARIKIPRYNAVFRSPKIVRCNHSLPSGQKRVAVNRATNNKIPPANRNRTLNNVSGSDDIKPNLPATEAEDQRMAKATPAMMKRSCVFNRLLR